MSYSIYEILAYFLIYSFAGWCIEVIYHAVVKGKFINRGFEIGPICPIYGFGAISVIVFLEPLKNNWIFLFGASIVFTTTLEFIAGFLLEKLFHEKWWDYSKEPYNIKGYVCPRFSIMWGLACVMMVDVIHPTNAAFVDMIPVPLGGIIEFVMYCMCAADLTVTLINVMHIRKSLKAIDQIERRLSDLSVSIGTNLSDGTLAIMDKSEQLRQELNSKQSELDEAIELARWVREDEKAKQDAMRRREYAELKAKLEESTEKLISQSYRLRAAFPNLNSGKYEHLFK